MNSSSITTRNTSIQRKFHTAKYLPAYQIIPAYSTKSNTLMLLHTTPLISLCKDTSLLFTFLSSPAISEPTDQFQTKMTK